MCQRDDTRASTHTFDFITPLTGDAIWCMLNSSKRYGAFRHRESGEQNEDHGHDGQCRGGEAGPLRRLPERVRSEDMVEETAANPDNGLNNRYNPEGSWNYYSCLALDLGL